MTTCYNAAKYIKKCIDSVKSQTYRNFIMVITDDCSSDDSVDIIKNELVGIDNIFLIENTTKHYQIGNYKQISKLSFVDDSDIIVTLDGDDWFPDDNVLARVVEYYILNRCLMCFGQFN
jgi:glycosyltransferase involved in cell wall biosynthesis